MLLLDDLLLTILSGKISAASIVGQEHFFVRGFCEQAVREAVDKLRKYRMITTSLLSTGTIIVLPTEYGVSALHKHKALSA
jgi:hypothetical protein